MQINKVESFPGATSIKLFYGSGTVEVGTGTDITPTHRGIAELLVQAPVVIARRVVVSESGTIPDEQSYNWEYVTDKLLTDCGLDWKLVPQDTAVGMEVYFSSQVPVATSSSSGGGGIKKIQNPLSTIEFFDATSSSVDVTGTLDDIAESICKRYGGTVVVQPSTADFSAGSLRRAQGTQDLLPL